MGNNIVLLEGWKNFKSSIAECNINFYSIVVVSDNFLYFICNFCIVCIKQWKVVHIRVYLPHAVGPATHGAEVIYWRSEHQKFRKSTSF